jgi:hypothetical protein
MPDFAAVARWTLGHARVTAALLVLVASVALSTQSPDVNADVKAIWGPDIVNGASQFATYRDLGSKIYEASLDWSSTAAQRPRQAQDPSDAAYVWSTDLTAAVARASRNHMQVALQIINAPGWANGGRPSNWAPKRAADFADFAAAAARRFPQVHLWMILGEPSRGHNFEPLTPAKPFAKLNAAQAAAPHRYARMLDAAYAALKRVSSKNLVIGGMTYTTGDISTQQWIENMRLPNGKPPRLDLYGHNPFSFRVPNLANPASPNQNVDFSDLARLAKLVDRNLGRKGNRHPRLFLSEWTIPTFVDQEFNFFATPAVQAQWITDGLAIARRWSRIYAVGWIHLYDDPPVTGGGLLMADGTKKPGYYAWKGG